MDRRVVVDGDLAEHLHADDGVDEEEHDDEEGDVRQSLERLDERPQQRPDALAARQELHQTHHTEQPEKVDADHLVRRLK